MPALLAGERRAGTGDRPGLGHQPTRRVYPHLMTRIMAHARPARAHTSRTGWQPRVLASLALALALAACTTGGLIDSGRDREAVRTHIERLLPQQLAERAGWAQDIEASFHALDLPADAEHLCAVLALTAQESSFQANPVVTGLPRLARAELERRTARLHIPPVALRMALQLESPDGRTFEQRLAAARTEKDLSELYEDFIALVPLGRRLLAGWNPVRTAGPMQVSIRFAQQHLRERPYPWTMEGSLRDELFTRRGGMYFGIAHLLDYPVDYPAMRYRFADFNAGRYASRNAAFQRALAIASGRTIAPDGDLIRHGVPAAAPPGETEAAARSIATQLGLSNAQIRRDLELGERAEFDRSAVATGVYAIVETSPAKRLPRAMLPEIRLEGPKIQRDLTTAWFARRVEQRWQQCLARDTTTDPRADNSAAGLAD